MSAPTQTTTDLYLDLLKQALTRYDLGDERVPLTFKGGIRRNLVGAISPFLSRHRIEMTRVKRFDPQLRSEGRDRPAYGETMVGLKRLDNLQQCVATIIADDIPGDLLEAGVWRGGASIFMRGLLMAYGITDRTVWVADSFEGMPAPNRATDPSKLSILLDPTQSVAVGLDAVKANFAKYRLLDNQVQFVKGWFSDTLTSLPLESLSLLRADGDMYSSTMDILNPLYPKVSPGGFVVIDDYWAWEECRRAVTDYRARFHITEPIVPIDWTGAFWRKET